MKFFKEVENTVGKGEMLVTSNFSFYRSVFKRLVLQSRKNQGFLAHLSTTCSRGAFRVVMCLSCVVNNFFKHLLLPNCWANLDQTWQECSLGGPLQKVFTEFDSVKNSDCHGNEISFLSNSLKIFSSETAGPILK